MAGETIKVPISVPVETNAAEAGDSVESLRDRIAGSTSEIKAMAGSLRQLRGTSDEVKAAKAALTSKIEAERNSVSAATLALVKQGKTYDDAAQKEKKAGASKKKLTGEVGDLKEKLTALKPATADAGGAMDLVKAAALGLYAAAAALVVGIAAAGTSLVQFILKSADAARNAGLVREAFSGTAKNASNLGSQIDALSQKVPTSKAVLNDLAVKLMNMRLPGQATVDTLNAVGQASAALGDEAAGKLQDFIARGRQFGMMRIDPREMLEGFGNLDFSDVAKSLAKNMGVTVEAAAQALRAGKVKIGDGAKAVKDAVESKFGGINLRKMMSFEKIAEKLHERFEALTAGVNLEPLLEPLSELRKLFDESTVTGSTLKMLLTSFGNGMVQGLVAVIPLAKSFFYGLVSGALDVGIAFHQIRIALKSALGDSAALKNIDYLKLAFDAGKYAAVGIAVAVAAVGVALAVGLAPIVAFVAGMRQISEWSSELGTSIRKTFLDVDWAATGRAIPEGILSGIKAGGSALLGGITTLAEGTKKAFKQALGIASPSKVFADYGENISEGAEKGIERGAPKAQAAASAMVSATGASGGGSGGGSPITINVTINAAGAEQGAAPVTSESFLKQLTKAVEDALVGAGLPVLS